MNTLPAQSQATAPAPQISVVMPVYNGEHYLAGAIDSILAQTFADFEFIIVDDGSADGSAAIIREYARRDARIRSLRMDSNQGISNALNQGIAAARGEFIARMDSDDVSLPQRFQTQLDYLRAHPDVGVLGSAMQTVDENLAHQAVWKYPVPHSMIVYRMLTNSSGFGHPSTMTRRSLLSDVGGYKAAPGGAEDLDLWMRLASRTRFANLPDTLLLYRRHAGALTTTRDAALRADAQRLRSAALQRLLPEASDKALDRLRIVNSAKPLGKHIDLTWRQRRLARRDLQQLLQAMLAANWLRDSDIPLLDAEFQRQTAPALPQPRLALRNLRRRLGA